MPFGVELHFDAAADRRVRSLWADIARTGLCSLMPDLRARPHLSLAVYETVDEGSLTQALRSFARLHAGLDLALAAAASFPGPENVVYVAPAVNSALLDLHQAYHEHVGEFRLDCQPYYRPGAWIPHFTVSAETDAATCERILGRVRESEVFGPARIVGVGLIEFRPVRPIADFLLQ